jgi:hypothetical protein
MMTTFTILLSLIAIMGFYWFSLMVNGLIRRLKIKTNKNTVLMKVE